MRSPESIATADVFTTLPSGLLGAGKIALLGQVRVDREGRREPLTASDSSGFGIATIEDEGWSGMPSPFREPPAAQRSA